MTENIKKLGVWVAGAYGTAAVFACLSCVIPPLASLLVWAGISGWVASATGQYLTVAGVFVLGVLGFAQIRKRRKPDAIPSQASGGYAPESDPIELPLN